MPITRIASYYNACFVTLQFFGLLHHMMAFTNLVCLSFMEMLDLKQSRCVLILSTVCASDVFFSIVQFNLISIDAVVIRSEFWWTSYGHVMFQLGSC
jgi:hypothetical protein